MKVIKGKSSLPHNGKVPNSTKLKPVVTNDQKISNYFGKQENIQTSSVIFVVGNDCKTGGLRRMGKEGQHGPNEQTKPED